MPATKFSAVVSRLGRALPAAGPPAADADLIGRFLATRDEAAFAELVRRHGPMVFGVCRRVTGDHHLAEDAFQAVFVVLAAKVAHVRPRSALSAWLYGVAYRTALRARTMADRRRRRETPAANPPEPAREATSPADAADLTAVLDEEIARLPDHLRLAVVLSELQGRPRKEAATELGIPEGTLSSRLATARKVLAGRLRRRGVALSAAGLSAALGRVASATLPSDLAARAVAAALSPGLASTPVSALSTGVLRAMFAQKLKAIPVALALAAVAVLAVGLSLAAPVAPNAGVHSPGTPTPRAAPQIALQPAPKAADPKPLPKGPNKLMVWRNGELIMIDPDGKNDMTALGRKAGPHPFMFALSPDGKQVAAVGPPPGGDESGQAHLFIRETGKDGPGIDLGQPGIARWSGDGASLAICQFNDAENPEDVRAKHEILDLATQKRTAVNLPKDHLMTDWSADGRYFATVKMSTNKDNPFGGIFVMNRDGSQHRQLTDPRTMAVAVFGRFSPYGGRVLFMMGDVKEETPAEKKARDEQGRSRTRPRYNKLALADVATGRNTPVADVPLNAELQGFCWSPDGKRIAYVWREVHAGDLKDTQDKDTVSSVVTCDPDGKNQKTILTETGKGQLQLTLGGVDWR
jgi:RNA polymerase sigma factor (sigma-70 family)